MTMDNVLVNPTSKYKLWLTRLWMSSNWADESTNSWDGGFMNKHILFKRIFPMPWEFSHGNSGCFPWWKPTRELITKLDLKDHIKTTTKTWIAYSRKPSLTIAPSSHAIASRCWDCYRFLAGSISPGICSKCTHMILVSHLFWRTRHWTLHSKTESEERERQLLAESGFKPGTHGSWVQCPDPAATPPSWTHTHTQKKIIQHTQSLSFLACNDPPPPPPPPHTPKQKQQHARC